MSAAASLVIDWTEHGFVPDAVIRQGVRRLLRERLDELPTRDCAAHAAYVSQFARAMRQAPIALVPDQANEQHYELPPEFFAHALGPHRKYSCCMVARGRRRLSATAEARGARS